MRLSLSLSLSLFVCVCVCVCAGVCSVGNGIPESWDNEERYV